MTRDYQSELVSTIKNKNKGSINIMENRQYKGGKKKSNLHFWQVHAAIDFDPLICGFDHGSVHGTKILVKMPLFCSSLYKTSIELERLFFVSERRWVAFLSSQLFNDINSVGANKIHGLVSNVKHSIVRFSSLK